MAIGWGQIETAGIVGGNERVVEIPLALEFMRLDEPGLVLDAGCALNGHLPAEHVASVIHLSLSLANEQRPRGNMKTSYLAWDIRTLSGLFGERAFHRTVSISTLEHVGLDNSGYGGTTEDDRPSQLAALDALRGVSRSLLITVPYRAEPIRFRSWSHWGPEEVNDVRSRMRVEARYWGRVNSLWVGGGTEPLEVDDDGRTETVHQIVALRTV